MKFEQFPWHQCKAHGAFFVPSLDPYGTRDRGLRAGYALLGRGARLYAREGSFRGLLGVMFSLRILRVSASSGSEPR